MANKGSMLSFQGSGIGLWLWHIMKCNNNMARCFLHVYMAINGGSIDMPSTVFVRCLAFMQVEGRSFHVSVLGTYMIHSMANVVLKLGMCVMIS